MFFTKTSRRLVALCAAVFITDSAIFAEMSLEQRKRLARLRMIDIELIVLRAALDNGVSESIQSHFDTLGDIFIHNPPDGSGSQPTIDENTVKTSMRWKTVVHEMGAPQLSLMAVMRAATPVVGGYIGRLEQQNGYWDTLNADMVLGVPYEDMSLLTTSLRTSVNEDGEPQATPDADTFTSNLEQWMQVIESESDKDDVVVSFGDGQDIYNFIKFIENPPPADISETHKKRFLYLFDEFVKTLLYLWFQLNFFNDGEDDGTPDLETDLGRGTWQDYEPLVVRRNARFNLDDNAWAAYQLVTLRVGLPHVDVKLRQMEEATYTADRLDWNPAAMMMAASLHPSTDREIQRHFYHTGEQVGGDTEQAGGDAVLRNRMFGYQYDELKAEIPPNHNDRIKSVMRASFPKIMNLRTSQSSCDSTNFSCILGPALDDYNSMGLWSPSEEISMWNRMHIPGHSEGNETEDKDNGEDNEIGQLQQNLDSWLASFQDDTGETDMFDSHDVNKSFANGSDLDDLIELIRNPEEYKEKERFLELFDKVFKNLLYFWFQLHFLHDGEDDFSGDNDGSTPDVAGDTWERWEARLVRRSAIRK